MNIENELVEIYQLIAVLTKDILNLTKRQLNMEEKLIQLYDTMLPEEKNETDNN